MAKRSLFELTGESGNLHCTMPEGPTSIDVTSGNKWVKITSVVAMVPGDEWLVLGTVAQPVLKIRTSALARPWPLALVLPPNQTLLLGIWPEPCVRNAYREFVFTWERMEPVAT